MGTSALNWIVRHRFLPLLILDLIAVNLAFLLTYYLRFDSGILLNPVEPVPDQKLMMMGVLCTFWFIVFAVTGLYSRQLISTSRYEAFADTFKAAFAGTIFLFVLFFDPGEQITATRAFLLTYGMSIFFIAGALRALFRTWVRALFAKRRALFNSIIIGNGPQGQRLYNDLKKYPIYGYEISAVFCTRGKSKPTDDRSPEHFQIEHLDEYLRNSEEHPVEFVLIALESDERDLVLKTLERTSLFPVRVMIIPDFFQILIGFARSRQLYGVPLMEVFPDLLPPLEKMLKRIMDIVAALFILSAGLPVMILTAIAVVLDSRGPILYRQKRMGYHGKEFWLYKFRTMIADAEKHTGPTWAQENDPRITRLGRFLRSTRIDELPQAWNVLMGHMSLVGPRPERRVFVEEFAELIPFYTRRLNVKPGLTGWAQVRRGYDASLEDVKEKLQYDLFYIENISIALDIKILLNTVWVVLTMKGR